MGMLDINKEEENVFFYGYPNRCSVARPEIGTPNNQRQHRTLHTVPRIRHSCEHFPDGSDLNLVR